MLDEERATVIYPAFETIWLAGPRPPRLRPTHDLSAIRVIQSICVPERLMQLRGAHALGGAGLRPTARPSARATSRSRCPDDPYEARMNTLGQPLPGMEVKVADPETGERVPPGRRRRAVLQGLRALRGLLQGPRADRGVLRRRGLLPLAGPGQARRRRPADLHRPAQGHAQGGRRERLGDRGRGLPRRPPGGQHRAGRRRARRAATARSPPRSSSSSAARPRPSRRSSSSAAGRSPTLQGPALRALRRRVADVGHEDPEVRPARAIAAELGAAVPG